MTDEMTEFLEHNYKSLPKDLTAYQKMRELSARVNDVYALNPNDESYIRACITDLMISKGELKE